jgi:hypothetical protein
MEGTLSPSPPTFLSMGKTYKLLKDHPVAKAGTIIEEYSRNAVTITLRKDLTVIDSSCIHIPSSVEHIWLEELKEEVSFTKEEAQAIRHQFADKLSQFESFFIWLDLHTSKEE